MKHTTLALISAVLISLYVAAPRALAQSQYSTPTGNENTNQGYGMHTGASTVFQAASFTINPYATTCQVGTLDLLGALGPFEMSMVSVNQTYAVDPLMKTLTSQGKMRSITRVGGVVVEDIIHPFIAVATDNAPGYPQPNTKDTFVLHFKTPFWHVGNPLCTASDKIPGGCKFGGPIFLGHVNVNNE
jgi:hypothetical protein